MRPSYLPAFALALLLSACGSANTSAYYYASLATLDSSPSLAQANRRALNLDRGPSYYTPTALASAAPETEAAEAEEGEEALDSDETSSSRTKATAATATSSSQSASPRPSTPLANLPRAISFQLEDQTGKKTAISFPRSKPIILAIADQDGSKQMEAWITPLYTRYTESIDIEGIADVAGIPPLVRGIAKGVISALVKQPVMLDWDGVAVRHFGAQKKRTNIIIIDAQGQVHGKISGPASPDSLAAVQAKIDGLLAAADE